MTGREGGDEGGGKSVERQHSQVCNYEISKAQERGSLGLFNFTRQTTQCESLAAITDLVVPLVELSLSPRLQYPGRPDPGHLR